MRVKSNKRNKLLALRGMIFGLSEEFRQSVKLY